MSFRKPPKGELPRYRLCWLCNKKFQGNSFVYFMNDDGTEHLTHQECAKKHDPQPDEYNDQAQQDDMDRLQLKGLDYDADMAGLDYDAESD